MSRICVKNLPKHVAEDRLRDVFSRKGEITDAKLMRTNDGKSRQFGFIGFRTEQEADEAIKYFNKSFIDTCRIICEPARKVGDPDAPRPWSRYSKKKDESMKEADGTKGTGAGAQGLGVKGGKVEDKKKKKNDKKGEEVHDPMLEEFLEVMQPRVKSKLWANDALSSTMPSSAQFGVPAKEGLPSKKENVTVVGAPSKKVKCAKEEAPSKKEKGAKEGAPTKKENVAEVGAPSKKEKGAKEGATSKKEKGATERAPSMKGKGATEGAPSKKEEGAKESVVTEDLSESGEDDAKERKKDYAVVEGSDMEYFKSRIKKDWSDSDSESNESSDGDHDGSEDEDEEVANNKDSENNSLKKSLESKNTCNLYQSAAEAVDNEETLAEDSDSEIDNPEKPSSDSEQEKGEDIQCDRLFVRNLPYTATEDELEEHFRRFGDISQAHLVVDKDTKRSKGIAYVQYALSGSAARAMEELDQTIFQGRLLHVMPAKEREQAEKRETLNSSDLGSNTLKRRREEERKASEASGNTRAWNILFMRPDTVVENIARRLGVSKSEFLDREANDSAVRMALGETQVIAETKKALENAGVNIASLEEFAAGKTEGLKRSNHVLLVKNLPYASSESELAKMFGKFGNLDKVILPPTKTLAIIIFLEPSEARAAFRGLAYKRYKDGPLYLEWAPANILNPSSTSKVENVVVEEHDLKRAVLDQTVEGISETDIDHDRIESRSLFVKNLNFMTADESLKRHMNEQMKEGKILSVRIKKHLKNGKNLSMGFGFIEFDSVETAMNVCQYLQGTVLDGHALILQICHAKTDEQAVKKGDKDKSSTKLHVKNVAFEATEKDLRQLFSPFGQIKSLRLPMKFGNHRGFAFVEFVTKQEAQNALQALASTHLYGRHLVLERAKEGESLEELRARTTSQFTESQNPAMLSRKRKGLAILDGGNMKFQRTEDQ